MCRRCDNSSFIRPFIFNFLAGASFAKFEAVNESVFVVYVAPLHHADLSHQRDFLNGFLSSVMICDPISAAITLI